MSRRVGIHTYVCMSACVCVGFSVCRHTEIKGLYLVFPSIVLLLSLDLIDLSRLSGLKAPRMFLSQPPQCQIYRHVLLCLPSEVSGLQACAAMTSFLCRFQEWDQGPYACIEKASLTEPVSDSSLFLNFIYPFLSAQERLRPQHQPHPEKITISCKSSVISSTCSNHKDSFL